MTPSEFAERCLNIELLDYQKEFMNTAYDAAKNHKQLIYIPPRGNSRFTLSLLQALAAIMVAQDEGLIKKEIIRE